MSRIGKQPIALPAGVTASVSGNLVSVKGPKGELSVSLPPLVNIESDEKELRLLVADQEDKRQKAYWGLARSLMANAVAGVSEGFSRSLEVNGVGYRAAVKGDTLVLNVGFSHSVEFLMPAGAAISVAGNIITISGIDKQLVGETAARIRKIKKPEPYGGKGIKYTDEVIIRKAGKVQKGGE